MLVFELVVRNLFMFIWRLSIEVLRLVMMLVLVVFWEKLVRFLFV